MKSQTFCKFISLSLFTKPKSHEGSGKGIASLMQMLIQDLEDEIKNCIKDEVETPKEYEADMKIGKT